MKEEGFNLGGTSAAFTPPDAKKESEELQWDGISEIILGRKEWFEAWMEGERACECTISLSQKEMSMMLTMPAVAMEQYTEIISASDAWLIADESLEDEESVIDRELRPTNSARRVKALVEQVTGKYASPALPQRACADRVAHSPERFAPLPQFIQRTRFLITVQIGRAHV